MASQDPSPRKRSTGASQMALAMELPFVLAGGALVGGLFGYLLDRWLHTKPFLMILIGALGFAVGLRDMLKRLQKSDDNDNGKSG
jgi:ATP synthase protein I